MRALSRRQLLGGIASSALVVAPGTTWSQRQNATRLIVPTAPGSALDIASRVMQPALNTSLDSSVYIENIAGASTTMGTSTALRARPDGATLCISSNNLLIAPLVFDYVRFHPLNDITPISLLGTSPLVVVGSPSFAPNTIQELAAALATQPEKFNYASPGSGTVNELASVMLLQQLGLKVQAVSYSGTARAMTAIMAGECQFGTMALPSVQGQIANGRLKALGICGSERPPSHPNIPLVSEQGVAGYRIDGWHLLLGPRGMSDETIQRIFNAFRDAANTPEIQSTLSSQANYYAPGTPTEAANFLKAEYARYETVVKTAGLRVKS